MGFRTTNPATGDVLREYPFQSDEEVFAQAGWRSKPSYYAISTHDRTINPGPERFMAKRMGAKTIELGASHLALISYPDEIARLILEAAGQQS